jgi:hypothetical protein
MPAQLTLPPVSTMKGTKLCWSAYLALLVAVYSSAATPGVVLEAWGPPRPVPPRAGAHHAHVQYPRRAVLVHLDVPPPLVCRPLRILHPWLNRRLDLGESPQLPPSPSSLAAFASAG